MNKKVSVIIPAYNSSKYLDKSINCLLNQSYDNLEIIIIDDASTDNTKKIIKQYALKDSRIMPFYSEINQGVSKSRNIGLSVFQGDYVVFLDADDFIKKDAIKIMVEKAILYDADLIDSYHALINKKKKFLEHKKLRKDLVLGNKTNKDMITKSSYITGKLIRRDLVEGMNFDESLSRYEDLLFEYELKLKLKNYVLIKDVLYYYYQVTGSLINTLGERHFAYLDSAKKILSLYKNEDKVIKDKVEGLLFSNAFLTGITKVIKNDKSIKENNKILYDYFSEFNGIFIGFEENKEINSLMKRIVKKIIKSEKSRNRIIMFCNKIDFIKLYFRYLSIMYKVED